MIELFTDTILPGDRELGLPPGSCIDMGAFLEKAGLKAHLEDYFRLLEQLAQDKFNQSFTILAAESRLQIVEQSKRKNNRLANMVILECLKAYYTDAGVLKRLGAGAVPPFPDGNSLEEDDWSLLEPVYERGRMYRLTET